MVAPCDPVGSRKKNDFERSCVARGVHCAAGMKRLAHLALFTLSLLACGGSVANDPNSASSSSGGSSSGGSGSGAKGSTGNTGQCDGIPECNPSEVPVASESACPQDTSCRRITACGVTIWCAQQPDQCEAVPTCPPGTKQRVDAYPAPGPEDITVTVCGQTIYCGKCKPPVCDPGDTPVKSQADCPPGASCYPSGACGVTVWCASK